MGCFSIGETMPAGIEGTRGKEANKYGEQWQTFWGSSEQRKSFWDQGKLSLKHVREQVVLLMGNKG